MASSDDDLYQDLDNTHGTDFVWRFSVIPLDLTGASATLNIAGLGSWAFTLTVASQGQSKISYFAIKIPAATTAGWAPGLYDYTLPVTFADGSVLLYGHGKLLVT